MSIGDASGTPYIKARRKRRGGKVVATQHQNQENFCETPCKMNLKNNLARSRGPSCTAGAVQEFVKEYVGRIGGCPE